MPGDARTSHKSQACSQDDQVEPPYRSSCQRRTGCTASTCHFRTQTRKRDKPTKNTSQVNRSAQTNNRLAEKPAGIVCVIGHHQGTRRIVIVDIRLVKIRLAIVIDVDVRNIVVVRCRISLLTSIPRVAHNPSSFLL